MPDDGGVPEQSRDVALAEARNALGVEAGERCAEVVTFAQDRQP